MVYADENAVNDYLFTTYGINANGELGGPEWSAAPVFASENTITFSAFLAADLILTYSAGIPTVGMFIQSGTEIMLITAVDITGVTVKRGLYGTTAADSAGGALPILTSEERVKACINATADIIAYHGIEYNIGLYLETELKPIAILHAIDLNRLACAIETAEVVNTISSGDFNDGVLSVSGGGQFIFSRRIRSMLDRILYNNGDETQYLRA